MTDAHDKPYGRDEVVAAVVDAATELFTEQGFKRVSMRTIAEKADVNPGLIHRHIGSKDQLITAVFESATRKSAAPIMKALSGGTFESVIAVMETSPFVVLMGRAIAEGRVRDMLERDFPMMRFARQVYGQAVEEGTAVPPADPQACVAFGTSALMGWALFRTFVIRGAGMEDWDDERIHREFARITRAVLGATGEER